MKVLSIFVLLASHLAIAEQKTEIDYSSGYCVRIEDEMNVGNAVVIVKNGILNNRLRSIGRSNDFFDFEKGVSKLYSLDWGGAVELIKLSGRLDGRKNIAVFSDNTHGGFVPPTIVKCSTIQNLVGRKS